MLIAYDGEWVSGDTGKPLPILLRDEDGIVDPSLAQGIVVRLREVASNRLVEGTGGTAPWPEPVNGEPATGVTYHWGSGGDDFRGEVKLEVRLLFLSGPVTWPTKQPLLLYFRDPA